MTIDFDFAYDASFKDFKGKKVLKICNGHIFVTAHTVPAKLFLEKFLNQAVTLNKAIKVDNKTYRKIKEEIPKEFSSIHGGFYYS